jgi:erythromycin esterase
MSVPSNDLRSSISELAVSLPNDGDLQSDDLSSELCSQFEDAELIGLGEASHGTQEFFDLRFRFIRFLVEDFGVRAVGFEAPFDALCRVDELVVAGEGDIRSLVEEMDIYRPFKTETMVDLFEWLQSYNASHPPEDHIHVYGFDRTLIENAASEIGPYLDRVGADIDASLREDIDAMMGGYDSEDERQALLERTRRVHSTLESMFADNESAWVEATSRQAYEHARHRLSHIETQLEGHERDREGRMALRDEAMAENIEWIHDRAGGPIVIWGANGHLNRDRYILDEWDIDVKSMGAWLADSYGEQYCPIAFELGGGEVAAKDFETEEIVEYPIPDPPSESIPDVFQQVDESPFHVSVEDLREDSATGEWLQTQPPRHNIWGGKPDGSNPVEYSRSDPDEFEWVVFVAETTPVVHLD